MTRPKRITGYPVVYQEIFDLIKAHPEESLFFVQKSEKAAINFRMYFNSFRKAYLDAGLHKTALGYADAEMVTTRILKGEKALETGMFPGTERFGVNGGGKFLEELFVVEVYNRDSGEMAKFVEQAIEANRIRLARLNAGDWREGESDFEREERLRSIPGERGND